MLGKVLTGILCTGAAGGAILFHEGAIYVNVKEKAEKGGHVFLVAPAAMVPWVIRYVPREKLPHLPAELCASLPAIAAGARELEDLPDTVLVEVESEREHVRVETRGGRLMVDVNSENKSVHLAVPLRMVGHALEELSARGPAR